MVYEFLPSVIINFIIAGAGIYMGFRFRKKKHHYKTALYGFFFLGIAYLMRGIYVLYEIYMTTIWIFTELLVLIGFILIILSMLGKE